MAKYGKRVQRKMKKVMEEYKHGKLKSGRSGKKVTSRKQAIAIGLSEARREGAKVPKKSRSSKSRSHRSTSRSRSRSHSSGSSRSRSRSSRSHSSGSRRRSSRKS